VVVEVSVAEVVVVDITEAVAADIGVRGQPKEARP
jgi:hypothetical protein